MPNWCYGTITPSSEKGYEKLVKLLKDQKEDNLSLCEAVLPMPKALDGTTSNPPKMEIKQEDKEFIAKLEEVAPPNYGEFEFEGNDYRRGSKQLENPELPWDSAFDGFNLVRYPSNEEVIELNKKEKALYDERVASDPKAHWHCRKYIGVEDIAKLVEAHGHSDWYGWKGENYGTKWGDCNGSLEGDGYRLETAWGPLQGPILKAIQHNIGDFSYDFEEEQGWGGEIFVTSKGSEVVDEYDTPPWKEISEEVMEGLSKDDQELLYEVVMLDEEYDKQGDTYQVGCYNYWDLSSFIAGTVEETLVKLKK